MSENVRICECFGKLYVRKNNKQKYCCNDCRMIMKAKKQHEYFKTHYRDRLPKFRNDVQIDFLEVLP